MLELTTRATTEYLTSHHITTLRYSALYCTIYLQRVSSTFRESCFPDMHNFKYTTGISVRPLGFTFPTGQHIQEG